MAEFEHSLQIMFGFKPQVVGCWLRVGNFSVPLALGPYIGPATIYMYAPAAYLWFKGITSDPYVYRYAGIVFFLINSWLLYYLLRTYYKPSISFYGTAGFMTTPLLFLGCLVEYGNEFQIMLLFVLLSAIFFSLYVKKGGVGFLLASALALGMTLLTRLEMFVWLVAPFVIYLFLVRPPLILNALKNVKNKLLVALLALVAFIVGAAPMIAYNLLCPTNNILSFVKNVILPKSLDHASEPLTSKLAIRFEQFWSYNLLNIWPMWELRTPNYFHAVIGLLCLMIIIGRWILRRQPSFVLTVILTSMPLSILTTGQLRPEHLIDIQPVILLVIISGLAYTEGIPRTKKFAHIAFIVLIAGNILVSAIDWQNWRALPATRQTYLNQSDPALLANYLSQYHGHDRILYTNIGLVQYVDYMTVGRLEGEEIMSWEGLDRFVDAVKLVLMGKDRRRVFVAVSQERDGLAGTLHRTHALYSILEQYSVPYGVTHLHNESNQFLYDVVVVAPGVGLKDESRRANTILITEVVDVRVSKQPDGDEVVIGSIHGTGLKKGDDVVINSNLIFPTAFGDDTWVSFSIPLSATDGQKFFTVEIIRPRTLERSRSFAVSMKE